MDAFIADYLALPEVQFMARWWLLYLVAFALFAGVALAIFAEAWRPGRVALTCTALVVCVGVVLIAVSAAKAVRSDPGRPVTARCDDEERTLHVTDYTVDQTTGCARFYRGGSHQIAYLCKCTAIVERVAR